MKIETLQNFLAFLIAILPTSAGATDLVGTAKAIDGDTILVDRVKVRLNGVDAPEMRETGGTAAARFMIGLINGKRIRCALNGDVSHDRVVGICRLDGQDIGAAIIRAGLARDCPRYSGGRYERLETPQARRSIPSKRYCKRR